MRVRNMWLIGMGGLAALVSAGLTVTSSAATATTQVSNHRVIVVFKNQETSLPPTRALESRRASAIHGIQAPVTSQLSAVRRQARAVLQRHQRRVGDGLHERGVAAEVGPRGQRGDARSGDPAGIAAAGVVGSSTGAKVTPLPGTCSPNPAEPQLEPQALQPMHADSDNPNAKTARSLGIDGAGVTVALHRRRARHQQPRLHPPRRQPRLRRLQGLQRLRHGRPTGGAEAFVDASSIAAQGREVYDIRHYQRAAAQPPVQHPRSRASRPAPASSASTPSAPRTRASTPRSCRRSTTRSRSTTSTSSTSRSAQQLPRRRGEPRPDQAGQRPGGRGRHGRRPCRPATPA